MFCVTQCSSHVVNTVALKLDAHVTDGIQSTREIL